MAAIRDYEYGGIVETYFAHALHPRSVATIPYHDGVARIERSYGHVLYADADGRVARLIVPGQRSTLAESPIPHIQARANDHRPITPACVCRRRNSDSLSVLLAAWVCVSATGADCIRTVEHRERVGRRTRTSS